MPLQQRRSPPTRNHDIDTSSIFCDAYVALDKSATLPRGAHHRARLQQQGGHLPRTRLTSNPSLTLLPPARRLARSHATCQRSTFNDTMPLDRETHLTQKQCPATRKRGALGTSAHLGAECALWHDLIRSLGEINEQFGPRRRHVDQPVLAHEGAILLRRRRCDKH